LSKVLSCFSINEQNAVFEIRFEASTILKKAVTTDYEADGNRAEPSRAEAQSKAENPRLA
jgi:hypothetical protein